MADTINNTGSINDITNLRFYTAKGYEIPMQKSYVLTWELIPGNFASQYIKSPISGYFIGDIDFTDPNQLRIKPGSLEVSFVKQGEIYVRFATQRGIDKNNMQVFAYDDIDISTGLLSSVEYYNYMSSILLHTDNKIKISINVKNHSFIHTFDILTIFTLLGNEDTYEEYTTVKTVYTGENLGVSNEFYQTIGVSKIDLVTFADDSEISYIQSIFEDNVPNIGVYFPFVRYAGDFYQEKVSTNFIAADTILVLEQVRHEDDTYSYVKPYINADSEYSLIFQPSSNSELKIIDKSSEYNILYKDEAAFSMSTSQNTNTDYAEPFSFAIAFQAEDEGAYQNLLGIYLKSMVNENIVFFMGAISIKTEVEGEDERFRTLLTNFGIPDPVNYSNIFAEQDYQEEGKDFDLINRKSKELMLTYDQIFSYVGTYKALYRAIKYLGYQDIIFKEWYTIKDQNDKLTDIAIQAYDSSTGYFLKQKLASYGVSIEDFKNYNKLNKLSMVYHFNEQSDDVEKVKTTLVKYDSSTESIDILSPLPRTFISDVPLVQPIYIYRNEETFAKLFAVKEWLEQHIIGVGAYIADITGEGIYFGWQKTQGYQTQHYLNDFSQAQYYTADVKCVLPFIESKGKIACTLNELNNAVRFIDYENTPIDAFDKYDISVNLYTDDGVTFNSSILTLSNSIEAPVLGDEYEFDLINRPNSGTLYEWTNKDSSSQILIQDGEINLLFDNDIEAYIDSNCLPIITLENANIHNAYGNWRSNIKWLIRETINEDTGNNEYVLQNYKEYLKNSRQKKVNQYVIIEPCTDDAYIKYSEKNKWDIPMFIVHGYKFANIEFNIINTSTGEIDEHDFYNLEDSSSDFILELLKGDMLFKDVDNCGCQLSFSSDLIKNNDENNYVNEQKIQPTYTYHSEKKAFVTFNTSTLIDSLDSEIECADTLENLGIELRTNIVSANNDILESFNKFVLGVPLSKNVAYNEASTFMNSSIFNDDISAFIEISQDEKRNEILDSSFTQIINNNYICNKTIDVEITRLGKYELIAHAFDKYNNIFTSKYDNTIDVNAEPIPIDTYIGNENSNNTSDFYKLNIDGVLQDSSNLTSVLKKCDKQILFPKSYHTYEIDYDLERDFVEFDNISYAIDTPKINDIVIFDTLTERCVGADDMEDCIRLHMLDENPNKISLYDVTYLNNVDPLAINTSINVESESNEEFDTLSIKTEKEYEIKIPQKLSIFGYNPLRKKIYNIVENSYILNSSLVNQENDVNFESDSYIDIAPNDEYSVDDIISNLNYCINNNYKLYVINTTEYPIKYNNEFIKDNIVCDYENRKTSIFFDSIDQVFNKEDVIKIRYYMNTFNNFNEQSLPIINETAYRIIDVSVVEDSNKSLPELTTYEYVIDGLPNMTLLDSSNVNAYIMYAAQHPVRYSTKVTGNAYEFNDSIGLLNYSIIRDHFVFNSSRLFLNNYIDDTYGIEINDYDYVNGEKYWKNMLEYFDNVNDMNMYYYHQFPVSVEQGTNVIFRSHNSNHTFKEGYKKEWRILTYSVDEYDIDDGIINNNSKEILFRSINDHLTIKPYMLGSHNIELTCTDIYGNRLVNKGEGLLYVKENPNKEYRNYSYI